MSFHLQRAVHFNLLKVKGIPGAVLDRAVLGYDESPGEGCNLVLGYASSCWQDGDRHAENKPNGCVVIGVPTGKRLSDAPPKLAGRTGAGGVG